MDQDEQLAVWGSFLRAGAEVVGQLDDELMRQQGIPLSWYEVLLHLDHSPERRVRMQDLAAMVLLSKSGLTRLIDRMEKAGLVTRQSCPSDRRGTFAALTEEGQLRFRSSAQIHLNGVRTHFVERLGEHRLADLRCMLELLL